MNEFITALITSILGVFIYVTGQYLTKFLLIPMLEIKKLISRINYLVVYNANRMHSPSEESEHAANELREVASRLLETMHIPLRYKWFRIFFNMPKKDSLLAAIPHVIGLSNSIGHKTPYDP